MKNQELLKSYRQQAIQYPCQMQKCRNSFMSLNSQGEMPICDIGNLNEIFTAVFNHKINEKQQAVMMFHLTAAG